MIAGPNGAGKTTFAKIYLPRYANCLAFINADLIAAGISPFNPDLAAIKAGRLMLEVIGEHVKQGDDFVIETTLSGRGYLQMIRHWRQEGYKVSLIFLQLDSPDQALARVAARVMQGGHNIAEETVRRRFSAGIRNFEKHYQYEVDFWYRYNNSGDEPVLIDAGVNK